ncbi:MAG: nucleotide exchange factor GrpE [Treponema sp.]|jgi:molecular chaperone GrpE|nr:nucleotide exchange factor GrpE [Treponema sp.]
MEKEERKEEPAANANETPVEQPAPVEQADAQVAGQKITDEEQIEEAPLDDAAKIEQLERQIEGLRDQYLRKVADFENFRKRMNREKQEAIEYANTALLLDIIQVMDDFERALRAASATFENAENWTDKDFQTFYEGVSMIEKRLSSQLENKWGLKRFDSAGEAFDPNRHEALMVEKSSEASEAKVAEDLVKGYTLKDRVIRPAKVKVTMPE